MLITYSFRFKIFDLCGYSHILNLCMYVCMYVVMTVPVLHEHGARKVPVCG
jgi:hypothetical protein